MDKKLVALLVCPLCKGALHLEQSTKELVCFFDRLAYPIRDDIPVMLHTEGRLLTLDEVELLKKQ